MDSLTELIANLVEKKAITLEVSLNEEIDISNVLQQLMENSYISEFEMEEAKEKISMIMGISEWIV